MVWSWPAAQLQPTTGHDHVAAELREWLPIIGDWPWYGPAGPDFYELYPNCSPYWNQRMDFFPYVQGPSSHTLHGNEYKASQASLDQADTEHTAQQNGVMKFHPQRHH